eukprot:COSAG02_NODE_264_length_26618_cov_244.096459_12_plen_172_part_00
MSGGANKRREVLKFEGDDINEYMPRRLEVTGHRRLLIAPHQETIGSRCGTSIGKREMAICELLDHSIRQAVRSAEARRGANGQRQRLKPKECSNDHEPGTARTTRLLGSRSREWSQTTRCTGFQPEPTTRGRRAPPGQSGHGSGLVATHAECGRASQTLRATRRGQETHKT